MEKVLNLEENDETKLKCDSFIKSLDSSMTFQNDMSSDSMSSDWLDEIEYACPYIDNIVRNPKLILINEESVVKIERTKKITVASVKDLCKHTQYIEKIDPATQEIKPSKILEVRNEETFNIYENRFIFTLITNMVRFVNKKEDMLENIDTQNQKTLEYAATTKVPREKVNIELKITSQLLPEGDSNENDFAKEIEDIKRRLAKVKLYINSWRNSVFMKSLIKENVSMVHSPIKKTNIILKNPNFQIAMNLWTYIQSYEDEESDESKEGLSSGGNSILKGLLDNTFLTDYFVLDSVRKTKKAQKEALKKYASIMINNQIKQVVSLLLNCGIKITDEEIMKMIAEMISQEKENREIGSIDVKKKFKSEMEEYLERAKEFL